MSWVTDVILITAINEDSFPNNRPAVKRFQEFFRENYDREMKRVDDHAGGDKGFQAGVYMIAIGRGITDPLLELFYSSNWTYRDCTMLLIKEEHDDAFKCYKLDDKDDFK